jgi:chorismate synthase
MAGNSLGDIFRITTFGESHGPAIGCIVDGVPSKIPLTESDIQYYLDFRRPGTSRFVTQRQEPDKVEILSGVFQGITTGTPIGLLIHNQDQKSKDYEDIKDRFRPGHADYTYFMKYGHRDYRGGGRSSARETAMRVAAGAVARKALAALLPQRLFLQGAVVQIGTVPAAPQGVWDPLLIQGNPFFAADPAIVPVWQDVVDTARRDGSSLGALVEVRASGIPVGLGDPVYDKLDADLAKALMSINAVKGVEIGDGFGCVSTDGRMAADEMVIQDGTAQFLSNHAGGILGGISTGQEIIARIAVKPTSSILTERRSMTESGENVMIRTKGRHDPCVGIRAVPVAEAMVACVLFDHLLKHRAVFGHGEPP